MNIPQGLCRTFSMMIAVSAAVSVSGCDQGVDSPRGFSLPQGDAAAGEQAIIEHRCMACHTIAGLDGSELTSELPHKVELGGASPKITTYAELVTSIINPSHRISRGPHWETTDGESHSLMTNYNDVMSVTELIDVVTYLQPKYAVKPLPYTPYSQYHIQ
jgi:sulfur-oxidizing protein SoxX